ncbi:MAG: CHAT domain-containing tetratricopeptide repeat protein [bacterium]
MLADIPLWRQQLGISEQLSNAQNQDSAMAIANQALLQLDTTQAASDTARAMLTYWLSECLSRKQDYVAAEQCRQQALALYRDLYGPNHPLVARCMSNLTLLGGRLGHFIEAEILQKQAIAILESRSPADDSSLVLPLNSLATLYYRQGRMAKAIPALKKAIDVGVAVNGPDDYWVRFCRSNLADIYRELGRYDEAEDLFVEILGTFGCMVAADYRPMDHARTLHDLALLHRRQGRSADALPLLVKARSLAESVVGEDHPAISLYLSSLAGALGDVGRLDSAAILMARSLEIRTSALGPDNYATAALEEDYSRLLRRKGEFARALPLAEHAAGTLRRVFADNALALSEKDALTYSRHLRSSLDNFVACFVSARDTGQAGSRVAAELILSGKGRVADGLFSRGRRFAEQDDPELQNLATAWRSARQELSQMYVMGAFDDQGAPPARIDSLSQVVDDLEAELSLSSTKYRRLRTGQNVSLDRIIEALPDGAVMIEYFNYGHDTATVGERSSRYLALVIADSTEPIVCDLASGSLVDSLVSEYRAHLRQVASRPYMPTATDKAAYETVARALYDCLLAPLKRQLDGKDLILIAPDAALNLVAFAGLVDRQGRYLIENNLIHYLTAGRELLNLTDRRSNAGGLLALGDPDFDAAGADRRRASSAESPLSESDRQQRSGCDFFRGHDLRPLPGTRQELESLQQFWHDTQTSSAAILLGPAASEEQFKTSAPGRQFLHLATHGYYLAGPCLEDAPDSLASDVTSARNPLLHSGLFLAGANRRGHAAGSEDSILTALEVSGMDLDGTDLVVLSACETALGEIEQGEGVYGLRRAFRVAGAGAVVSALWPIPDQQTAGIIGALYGTDEQSLAQRLRQAQLDCISELRAAGFADHPLSMGCFRRCGRLALKSPRRSSSYDRFGPALPRSLS